MWSAHRWNCRVAIRFSDWSEMSVFSLDLLREYFYIPTEINNENISPFGKYLLLVPTTSIKHHVFLFFFWKSQLPRMKIWVCLCFTFPESHKMETKHHLFTPKKPSKASAWSRHPWKSGTTKLLSLRWRRTLWGSCNGKFVERPPNCSTLGFYKGDEDDVNWKKNYSEIFMYI